MEHSVPFFVMSDTQGHPGIATKMARAVVADAGHLISLRSVYSTQRLNTRQPLVPPKPNEFDMA